MKKAHNLTCKDKRSADAAPFWARVEATREQDADSAPLRCAVVSDIIERRRAEEARVKKSGDLAQSNADLTQFAHVASHDLQSAMLNLKYVLEETRGTIIYGEMPSIVADEPQMTQLFQNLIGNSPKFYGEEAPRVEISAVREGNDSIKFASN